MCVCVLSAEATRKTGSITHLKQPRNRLLERPPAIPSAIARFDQRLGLQTYETSPLKLTYICV